MRERERERDRAQRREKRQEWLRRLGWGEGSTSPQIKLTQVNTEALCKGPGINGIGAATALRIKYRT